MSLVYIRSFKKTEGGAFVTFSTIKNPKRISVEEIRQESFLSTKRYGWFQKVGDSLVDVGSVSDERVYQLPCYLTFVVSDGTLSSFKLVAHKAKIEYSGKEKDVLSNLFSILRTLIFDVVVTKGVKNPESFLKDKYSSHHDGEFWMSSREFIDVDLYCERYGKRKLNKSSEKVDLFHLIIPNLMDAANFLGRSCQELLELEFEPKPLPDATGRNLLKVASKPFVLDCLSEGKRKFVKLLPQRECLEILSSDLNATLKYDSAIRTPEINNNEYLYYRPSSYLPSHMEVVDEIAFFARISGEYYELNQRGELNSSVPLSERNILEKIKKFL